MKKLSILLLLIGFLIACNNGAESEPSADSSSVAIPATGDTLGIAVSDSSAHTDSTYTQTTTTTTEKK